MRARQMSLVLPEVFTIEDAKKERERVITDVMFWVDEILRVHFSGIETSDVIACIKLISNYIQ